jgi:hypothetical protein
MRPWLLVLASLSCTSSVTALERAVLPGARPDDARACADFSLTPAQVERFFARATPVTAHEADVAACVVRGRLRGQAFEINALWSGQLALSDGGVEFVKCEGCDDSAGR